MTCILLVDDDEMIRFATSEVLTANGYDVCQAENGHEAMDVIKSCPVDLVLLDIFMPERDGLETIGDIRAQYPNAKIIAMSGFEEKDYKPLQNARLLGADDILSKPFGADLLLETLERVLKA